MLMLNATAFMPTNGGFGGMVFVYFILLTLLGIVLLSVLVYLLLFAFKKIIQTNLINCINSSLSETYHSFCK
jgi:hypothetical protein